MTGTLLVNNLACNPCNVAEERDGPVPENLDRQGDCPGPGLSGLCAYCPQVYNVHEPI